MTKLDGQSSLKLYVAIIKQSVHWWHNFSVTKKSHSGYRFLKIKIRLPFQCVVKLSCSELGYSEHFIITKNFFPQMTVYNINLAGYNEP